MTLPANCNRASERNFIALASLLYILMHAGILFIPLAVFWDDWVLVDTPKETTLETFRQLGSMFNVYGYLHFGLTSLGIWNYKLFTFLLMGAAGYFLNSILKRNDAFGRELRFNIVLLFILLPFNTARVAMIDFPYIVCYALFFGGWLAIDRHRILAAILFFLSFNTNSLLVFYALPILDLLYRSSERLTLRSLFRVLLSRWELIALPFLYFFIKITFYKPVGFYAGYNQEYNMLFLSGAIKGQIKDLLSLKINLFPTLIFLPIFYALLNKALPPNKNNLPSINNWALLSLGIVAIILGGFPYWILGYTPTFLEWTSRHQLLMPLGAAIFISGVLRYLPRNFRIASTGLIISACLSYGITNYINLYIDWQKQLFILEKFKTDPVVAKANLLIIEDHSKTLDAIGRTYRFYEWNGMLVRALGDERRFALEPKSISEYAKGNLDAYFDPKYKAGAHNRNVNEPIALINLAIKSANKDTYFSPASEIEYTSRLISSQELQKIADSTK